MVGISRSGHVTYNSTGWQQRSTVKFNLLHSSPNLRIPLLSSQISTNLRWILHIKRANLPFLLEGQISNENSWSLVMVRDMATRASIVSAYPGNYARWMWKDMSTDCVRRKSISGGEQPAHHTKLLIRCGFPRFTGVHSNSVRELRDASEF